jgi:hypothetical protein
VEMWEARQHWSQSIGDLPEILQDATCSSTATASPAKEPRRWDIVLGFRGL